MNGLILTDQVSLLFPNKFNRILVSIKNENDLTKQSVHCLSMLEYHEFLRQHYSNLKHCTADLNDEALFAEALKEYITTREAETELLLTPTTI